MTTEGIKHEPTPNKALRGLWVNKTKKEKQQEVSKGKKIKKKMNNTNATRPPKA
ncbi:MAG: hypothetical protein MJ230_00405 [bacterium]|nr:hypothetical protein [bacterium]